MDLRRQHPELAIDGLRVLLESREHHPHAARSRGPEHQRQRAAKPPSFWAGNVANPKTSTGCLLASAHFASHHSVATCVEINQ